MMNRVATSFTSIRSKLSLSNLRTMSTESNKKVAVILSGCGVQDGSEIHESVFLLNTLEATEVFEALFLPLRY